MCVNSLLAFCFSGFGGAFIYFTTASFTLIESEVGKILVWMVYKALAYWFVNLISKIACYGTEDDFQSLLVVFTMV